MKEFYWKGLDAAGNQSKGIILTSSQETLKEELFEQNIALLSSHEKKAWWRFKSTRIKEPELLSFFEQLATLVEHGVQLSSALETLESTTQQSTLLPLISSLKTSLNQGHSLSNAFSSQKIIPAPYLHLIQVGEKTGQLGQSLRSITNNLQQQLTLKQAIKAAARMPLFTLAFALTVVLVIFVVIIPQFATLFSSFEKPLPLLTQRILSISSFITSTTGLLILLISTAIASILHKYSTQTAQYKKAKELLTSNLPLIATITRNRDALLLLNLSGSLLQAGIPLQKTLKLIQEITQTKSLKQSLSAVEQDIANGHSLYASLKAHLPHLFDPETLALINVGEQTGDLASMLNKSAALLHKKLSINLSLLTTFVQPLLLIATGIIIVLLMVSIYLPIFYMADIT